MIDMKSQRILVLGGTGTLGRAICDMLIEEYPGCQITVLSRDEHKQAKMKREFPLINFVIGDIRDKRSIDEHFHGKDIVFHVAALKHVDILEANVGECIRTNILGTMNAAECALNHFVKHFIFSSTDKAVDPINAYGYAKALSEKILYSYNQKQDRTKFAVYRWGNVVGSQGSVIPVFAESIKSRGTAFVTDMRMTRFWLPIEWAVRYMLRSFAEAYKDKAMICPNMKAARVVDVAQAISVIVTGLPCKVIETKIRPGEKLHENLLSAHHDGKSSEHAENYSTEELIEILTPIVRQY